MDGAVRRKAAAEAGFTLLELVIAMSLASVVLVAVVSIAAQMVRFQMEGIRSGTITGWSLVSVTAMGKEIENANVMAWPTTANPASDTLIICQNWSRLTGGKIDTSAAADVTLTYYCYNPTTKIIWRYSDRNPTTVTCPAPPTPALPACDGSGTYTEKGAVATNVERDSGASVFTRDDAIGGVRIRYLVGSPTPTTNRPKAVYMPFDVKIGLQKQYNNTVD